VPVARKDGTRGGEEDEGGGGGGEGGRAVHDRAERRE